VQSPIRIDDHNEPQSDVTLLRTRSDSYREPQLPSADDVLLVIEVADTSLRCDREVKLPVYALHGIQETWIVDVAARAVEVHRVPRDGAYRTRILLTQGDTLAPMALPGARIAVSDLI